MSKHTPGPWRYREWGGLIVGGGAGSAEVLICTMATNTRHDEGRHNHALILAAPTMQARIAELEAERDEFVDAEARAEAELVAARVDAERYRELRRLATAWPQTVLVVNINIGHDWRTADAPEEIDSVVDAAIDAARGES